MIATELAGVVAEHIAAVNAGDTIVRGAYDGDFDRAGLPDELILSNYFSVRDGKIVSLVVIRNQPAAY